jgi:hypothetical protein
MAASGRSPPKGIHNEECLRIGDSGYSALGWRTFHMKINAFHVLLSLMLVL